ncbi:MAG TPA: LysE family translocator [Steroidobacteraceae bacterium]|nr:LysE family translocator [Steroidobacteraceae bacterium]
MPIPNPLPCISYAFVMSITPGPNNVMLTASGARFGFRRTLPHLAGVSTGFVLLVAACCAGLGALFLRWPALQGVLRWAGSAYLLFLGWQLLRAGGVQGKGAAKPVTFLEGLTFQYVNPKGWVMAITAATLFMPTAQLGPVLACLYVTAISAVVGPPCSGVWALFGSSLRHLLQRPVPLRLFNAAMALALAATGIMMVTRYE